MAKITIEDGGVRLDAFLADHYKDLHTRSQITKAIKSGKITLNDGKIKCGTILKTGDIIEVDEDAIEGGEVTAMLTQPSGRVRSISRASPHRIVFVPVIG